MDGFEWYAKVVFEEYGEKVKYWVRINEEKMMMLDG
ncbi:family 1 glycosylhydrolase [Bacillus pumilus]|nr:family 1 glycosylhydrolase [Bacillus pumilus]